MEPKIFKTALLNNRGPSVMSAVNEGLEATVADLGALLDAGEGAVVTLVAGETRLAAHRAVLGARSPVFAATFRHDTAEARRGKVVIRDVEGPVLRQLLVYCYTGEAPQLAGVAPQLLTAADKYGLTALKGRCEQQLVAQLDVHNAAAAAVLAVRHSCPGLVESAVAFIREHSHRVMASQGWADAVLNSPCEVIEIHRLLADLHQESSEPTTQDSEPPAATPPEVAHGGTPAAAVPPPTDRISRVRNLSAKEKSSRLLQAAKDGALEDLRALLAVGADTGFRDRYGWRALHYSAYRGDVQAVRSLLNSGAEVDARTLLRATPLHLAAVNNHAAVVAALAASGADVDARAAAGLTPLHDAAAHGNAEAATALLRVGANKGARAHNGLTPLHAALVNNKQQLIDILK
ncbi:ankyrin repeat and protein kinase domain-containing protein 1-like isoform X10 [Schistocerca gregaria]|uniref:ankyrin repeat and protein kinase domain-containing protein 1-like isoform X9 n=1 Tax=Schistocerca gregaria TaxID=7010 RepID=UPI00211F01D7|nr:ankyrin repeat and protein kinase domain-containing protein 1-like isoform X9 [Schistocerca gregaria]XP_049843341.1 ankyrin repeat and protein kinase domain-containing protein 1-like isoform X10 [Schistocerca gregaria]